MVETIGITMFIILVIFKCLNDLFVIINESSDENNTEDEKEYLKERK